MSVSDRKAQAIEVFELMKKTEDLSKIHKSNKPMYILSMKWFKKWTKYCYFHHITGDHSEKKEELNAINNQIIDSFTSDEEEENPTHVYPGLINQNEILEEEENETMLDPDEGSNYNNDVIKKELEENKDYIIVNEKIWNYLSGFYQGREIKRYVINVNDKDYYLLEIVLKKVMFLLKKISYYGNNFFI